MASTWGTSWGTSWATSWDGVAAPIGDPPAGTVPIRYVVGTVPNVVPVVTVGVYVVGVVYVREYVGPENVVPVREVVSEVPHVKVMVR